MKKILNFLSLFLFISLSLSIPLFHANAISNTAHLIIVSGTRSGNFTGKNAPPYSTANLSDVDIALLSAADGFISGAHYYFTDGSWPVKVSPSDPYNKAHGEPNHLHFVFSNGNIPQNAVIDNVTLNVKYFTREGHLDGIKMEIFNGVSFTDINLPIPTTDDVFGEVIPAIDITSIIDTPSKANSINTNFLAYALGDYSFARTAVDFIGISVTYHTVSPVSQDQNISKTVDNSEVITLSGTDPSNLPLTYEIVDKPTKGTLGDISGNQVTYTPTGEVGVDTFTFKVNNGIEDSPISTVHINLSHGEVSSFKIVANPTSLTLNDSTILSVSEQDRFNNIISDDNSTSINFSSDIGIVVNPQSIFSAGIATTNGKSNSAGLVNFTATNGVLSSSVSVNFTSVEVVTDTDLPVSVSTSGGGGGGTDNGDIVVQNHHAIPIAVNAPIIEPNTIPTENISPVVVEAPINEVKETSENIPIKVEKPKIASVSVVKKTQPIKNNISKPSNLFLASASSSPLFSIDGQNDILKIMKKQGILIIVLIVTLIIVGLVFFVQKGDQSDTSKVSNEDSQTNTKTEFKVSTLSQGSGIEAVNGDTVTVNYTGTLENGTVFDSNVDQKFSHVQPFQFVLGAHQVIQGWDKGVLGMKVGEKRHLIIPSDLAYGAQGQGPIPPNSTLIFDVEVTAISHK